MDGPIDLGSLPTTISLQTAEGNIRREIFRITSDAKTVFGENSYSWTVPEGLKEGRESDDYRILVQVNKLFYFPSLEGSAFPKDESDANFTISSDISSPSSAVTVLTPNGGETWRKGKTYSITWNSTRSNNIRTVILLERYDDPLNTGIPITVKTFETTNLGSYFWSIDSNDPLACPNKNCPSSGSKFKVRIFYPDIQYTELPGDASDGFFSIISSTTTPAITVLSLNDGEKWEIGETYKITWNLAGFPLWNNNRHFVQLQLWDSTGTNFIGSFCTTCFSTGQGGSYDWTIGSVFTISGKYIPIQSGQYRIRASVVGDNTLPAYPIDFSNAPFTITSTTPYVPTFEAEPKITVRGHSYHFTGKITNAFPDSVVYFFLQRPDGTMLYDKNNDLLSGLNRFTDADGNFTVNASRTLTVEGQVGTYTSWVTIDDITSNKINHTVISSDAVTVTVLSPNGGEAFAGGNSMRVAWQSKNAPSDSIVNVISLVNDSGQFIREIKHIGDPGLPANGELSWTIPTDIPNSRYKVYIQLGAPGTPRLADDLSDAIFNIITPIELTPTPIPVPPISPASPTKIYTKDEIFDGDLIRAQGDIAVWIVKVSGEKRARRRLFGPQIFTAYGHLGFHKVKNVSKETLNLFATSNLIRKTDDERVYELTDFVPGVRANRRWVPTLQTFKQRGFDFNSVYIINDKEFKLYIEGPTSSTNLPIGKKIKLNPNDLTANVFMGNIKIFWRE